MKNKKNVRIARKDTTKTAIVKVLACAVLWELILKRRVQRVFMIASLFVVMVPIRLLDLYLVLNVLVIATLVNHQLVASRIARRVQQIPLLISRLRQAKIVVDQNAALDNIHLQALPHALCAHETFTNP